MNYVLVFVKLYGPLLLFLILMIIVFTVKKSDKMTYINLNLLGLAQYRISISNVILSRVMILLTALISLSAYLYCDYSKFFPNDKLKMEVFFEKKGIQESLKAFTKQELNELNIVSENYEKYQSVYYNDLDKELRKILHTQCFFTLKDGIIYSEGETSFVIEKIAGLQNYYIRESKGELNHVLERPNDKQISFKSFFEKVNSSNDYLTPSLIDIYIKHAVILKPRFKQIIAEYYRSDGVIFHHTLYGITKIKLFPFPMYSNTIYLYENKTVGLIPIGYAVYR